MTARVRCHRCCEKQSIRCLPGDIDTGKAILRDYIKTTVGFEKLGAVTGTSPKSLCGCSAELWSFPIPGVRVLDMVASE
jgi:hypothetical protein